MIIPQEHLERINNDLGAQLPPFECNNEFHHFGVNGLRNASKKPLWSIGKVWEFKGNAYYIVQYGDFRGGSKFQLASYKISEQSAGFKKEHNEQIKAMEERAKKEREEKRKSGIEKWKPRFYQCPPGEKVPVHEYLKGKSLESNYRARVDYRHTLMIPLETIDEDLNYTFEGVQMVYRHEENFKWMKSYNTGVVKKGSFTRVTEFEAKKAEFIYLCEGYATACSVYFATGVPTVCAFDSNNLDVVIEKLKLLNPDVKIIICADDDFQTIINGKQVNVGIMKALACQRKFQNVTYRKPKFATRIDETDFNDLHILEGIDAVRDQLKINRAEFTDVILLGHSNLEDFYYLSTQTRNIVTLSPSKHKAEWLKALANEKYWAEKYGHKKDKITGEMIPDWTRISDTILQRQRDIGEFNPRLIRGLGVWSDEGRIFVNYGQGVYKASEKTCVSNIDPHLGSKNFYSATNGDLVNFDDELTDDEMMKIATAVRALNFKNDHDYVYILGFIAAANVFGALDWRPHLWLTAPAGSGKSWVLKRLADLIYYHISLKKPPTVAGAEQIIGRHAKVTVIDEAEASERTEALVEMARQASTLEGGIVAKGTADGQGAVTEVNTCFMMASIEPPHFTSQADDTRFFIVDLKTNEGQTIDEFLEIEKMFDEIKGMGQRLMVRMVNNIDLFKRNIVVAKNALRVKKITAREADQLAPIISGFIMFFGRSEINEELVHKVIEKMDLIKSDYLERNEDDQSERVYSALMMLQINNMGLTMREALKTSQESNKTHSDLLAHGVLWSEKHQCAFFAATAPLLDRKMKNFGIGNWRKVLERSPAFVRKNVSHRAEWAASGVSKGMLLSITL